MDKVKDNILTRLKEIEQNEQIKILYAVESGSRGWGFESKDSDYDVRFIYAHPLDWYLSIKEKGDVIEYPISNQLDINGWDIEKVLKLFKKSNPPLYEWLASPIIYLEQGDFVQRLRKLIPEFYSPVSSMHHYLHMAQGNYKAYLIKEKVKIKKYFYVLRPILACMWIEEEKSMPPMEFEKLFNTVRLDREVTSEIKKLIIRKRLGAELNSEDRIEVIITFLEEKLNYFEDYMKKLPSAKNTKVDSLDKLFREIIK